MFCEGNKLKIGGPNVYAMSSTNPTNSGKGSSCNATNPGIGSGSNATNPFTFSFTGSPSPPEKVNR